MSLDKIVEEMIKRAQERGEFENLSGKGKPIDLTEYFEMPEEVRVARTMLKDAGMAPREVELLKEIAELRQILARVRDGKKRQEIQKQIQEKQIEFSMMIERQKKQRR
jgi:DnaJ homologue, subfamily C, member 28, conserved domain